MAASEMTVRAATEADAPVLGTFPGADKVEQTLAAAARGEAHYAVVEVAGRIVGSAVLELVSELAPEVKRIWVPRDERRKGRGSAMTTWLEDIARDLGHDACHMAIDPENERAIPMAIELGYSATGDHLGTTEPDEVHGHAEQGDPHEGPFAVYRKSLTMS